ncbi:MAG: FHA domain-containing protein, partial [Myxococcota bacterium]
RTHAILKLKAAGRTRLIVFDTQDLTLGRATENDISVDDPEMSRRHAVFKRSREGCAVEDMGTSNGTEVNGQVVQRAVLEHGDVVKIGAVELTYAETTRAPSSLGPVEYASQIKSFGTPMARMQGGGEATILGLADAPTISEDEEFEVRPSREFEFDLRHSSADKPAARDLDPEVADLDLDPDFSFGNAKTKAPAPKPAPRSAPAPVPKAAAPAAAPVKDVWELDDAPAKPVSLAVALEIDGLTGELRRAVEALVGKVIELPSLRVRIKGRDLG